MLQYCARLVMIFAMVCSVLMSITPSYAAKAKPNTSKIDRCLSKVDSRAKRMGSRLPSIIHQKAQRMCWITESTKTSIGVLSSLSLDAIQKAVTNAERLQVQQGFDGQSRTQEPGLLGLDGAREVLTSILMKEAVGIWSLAEAVGGPEIPSLDPNSTKAKTQTLESGIVINQSSGGISQGKSFVEQYVDVHIRALEDNPDTALSLKVRMYKALKDIALRNASQNSSAEKRFLASFEAYIRTQYVAMIDAAIEEHSAWETENNKNKGQSLAGNYAGLGAAPPDFFDKMGAALVVSAYAGALGSMIAGASTVAASSAAASSAAAAAAAAQAAALANSAMASLAANSASAAAIASTTSTVSANAAASISTAASTAGSIGGGASLPGIAITGPVMVVVGAVLVGILGTKAVAQRVKIEKKMDDLKAWKARGKVSAKAILGTRDGTVQFQHFYTKATSSSSPAGYVNPADGCRVCMYSEKNFEGEMACTHSRVRDLNAFESNGTIVKLNNKVSSIALDQTTCEASYAMLYDSKNLKGNNRQVIRSNVADLSAFARGKNKTWDNAASSVSFTNKNAPKCEVCVYSKANQQGSKFCAVGGVGALGAVGMADKITSVVMNTRDCPKAKAWLYNKKNFELKANGTGITELTKSVSDLGRGVRNTASSLFFATDGVNPYETKATGGCRACMYDLANHKGEYMCVNANIPDMSNYRIAGEVYNFKNKATSVAFLRDSCKPNDTMELEMFSKPNYKGKVVRIFGTDVTQLNRSDNNIAASAKLNHRDASKMCQVCMYKEANFQGEKVCVNKDTGRLSASLNNSISSIRVEKGACASGGAAIYANRNYDGDALFVMGSISNLKTAKRGSSGNWNNHLSSVKFSSKMADAKAAAEKIVQKAINPQGAAKPKEDPATLCQVCLYKDKNYGGAKQCVSENKTSLNSAVANSASSIKVFRGACPNGGALVYGKKNFGGKSAYILNSDADLRKIQGSSDNWNNTIASIKFSKNQRDILVSATKRLMPMLSDAKINAQISNTYGE